MNDFTSRFQRILPLIRGGPAWLQWALSAAEPAFDAAEESELLGRIQSGLHRTRVAVFPSAGLRLAPEVLLCFGVADFSYVLSSLETGRLTPAALEALACHRVRTEADFAAMDRLLAALGVAEHPLLRSLNLSDQVRLYESLLTRDLISAVEASNVAAARFAAEVAQCASDFGAAFWFHRAVAAAQPADARDSRSPTDVAGSLWTSLTPLVFPYLQCPSVSPVASPAEVRNAIQAYLRKQPVLGFRTLATALCSCADHAGLDLSTGTADGDAAAKIGQYMEQAARCLMSSAPRSAKLFQDGLTCRFAFEDRGDHATVQLDGDGSLSLVSFVRQQG